jgi:hypothetical protein
VSFLRGNSGGFVKRTLCAQENLARAGSSVGKDDVRDARWEWERYAEIVGDWNASARGDEGVPQFFAFAAREMESEKTPIGSLLRRAGRMFRRLSAGKR